MDYRRGISDDASNRIDHWIDQAASVKHRATSRTPSSAAEFPLPVDGDTRTQPGG
jgi:hypothetical protein